jgi:hypothetical protein|tara:strand:+ start:568 stop:831 length:264 start_codon:yes stop_codon:yes gene_type:complete
MFSKEETFALLEDEEALIANGFDEAIIGITFGSNMITVYSVIKIINILMEEDEMSFSDALEHFEYNIAGSYVGEKTPIFVYDIQEDA